MTEVCSLLDPVKQISDTFMAEKYSSISLVLPTIRQLQNDIGAMNVLTEEAKGLFFFSMAIHIESQLLFFF